MREWIISATQDGFMVHEPSVETGVKTIATVADFNDARLIITAVNSHSELLAAAKKALEALCGSFLRPLDYDAAVVALSRVIIRAEEFDK